MTFSLSMQDGAAINAQTLLNVANTLSIQMHVEPNSELTDETAFILKASRELIEIANPQISCDNGIFEYNKKISWLLVDWGEEKALSQIQIKLTAPNANCKGKVKIFTNGYWLPLMPIDIINLDNEQTISPIFASKIMIELVEAGEYAGLWNSNPTKISEIKLSYSDAPADIEIDLANKKSIFKQIGLLSTVGWKLTAFAEQINLYLKQNPNVDTVPLQIRAKTAGKVYCDFKAVTQKLITHEQTLILKWHHDNLLLAQTSLTFTLAEKDKLREVSFSLEYTPLNEKQWFLPINQNQNQKYSQFINQDSQIAQQFNTTSDYIDLSGIDIQLIKRSDTLKANLALYPDKFGYPTEKPYSSAVFTIDENSQWQENWLIISFDRPLRLTDKNWWLVLTMQEGEAFWQFAKKPDGTLPIAKMLYLKKPNSWLSIDETLLAQTRIRLVDNQLKNLNRIIIQRGNSQQEIAINKTLESYQVNLTTEQLNLLNQDDNVQLALQIIAEACGTIQLKQLRITYSS